MKILFCIYQLDFADHIALSYLSAVAREMGHSTFLCVLGDSSLMERVAEVSPDVVAYSANVWGFREMVAAHREARAQQLFVSIMGGPQPTFSPETFSESGVDAYCVGEGDLAFGDFLRRVEKGESFDDVPNLITRKGRNEVRPLVKDLDSLPFPDRDLVLANSFLKDTPKKTFYATRGCPFKCTYCANNYYHELYRGKGAFVRRFSVDRLLREMEYVKERYRTEFIKLGDDLFVSRVDDWFRAFAEEYPMRIGVPFNCFLRFDTVEEELLSLLRKAGCYSVHLSVDSISAHVRENILGRKMRKVDIAEKLAMIRDHGIRTWVNYMLAAPESTLDDDLRTIDLSRKCKVTYASYSTTVPTAGTGLYDYCVEKGLIDPDAHTSDMTGCSERTTLSCFSEKEKDIRYNIYLLGAVAAKLPQFLGWVAMWMIRHVPPNAVFARIRSSFYRYSIENTIFRLHASSK